MCSWSKRHCGIFQSNFVQVLTSLVIACAFITNIISIDAELQADEASNVSRMLQKLEIFYVYCFTVELVFNVLANVFWPFVIDLWNYLDIIVVIICGISYLNTSSDGISEIKIVQVTDARRQSPQSNQVGTAHPQGPGRLVDTSVIQSAAATTGNHYLCGCGYGYPR